MPPVPRLPRARGRGEPRAAGPGLPARQLRHLPHPQRSHAGRHGPALPGRPGRDAGLRRPAQGGRPGHPGRAPPDPGCARDVAALPADAGARAPSTCRPSARSWSTTPAPSWSTPGSGACRAARDGRRAGSARLVAGATRSPVGHRPSGAPAPTVRLSPGCTYARPLPAATCWPSPVRELCWRPPSCWGSGWAHPRRPRPGSTAS